MSGIPNDRREVLLAAAREACRNAHAIYSNFPVGAALLTVTGEIITGVNVENISYGLTICAERSAIARAVSEGHTRFEGIAVWAGARDSGHVTPCGACRQVLAEFMLSETPVFMAGGTATLGDLLPAGFGSDESLSFDN